MKANKKPAKFEVPSWKGHPCAILASGPSMSRQVADKVRRIPNVRVIAVNTTFLLAPWADMVYAADAAFWTHTPAPRNDLGGLWRQTNPTPKDFAGLKVTVRLKDEAPPLPDVKQLQFTGVEGYDKTPGNIRTGNNSGYQAIHVAAQAEASPILLFGFDLRGGHWHERHPKPLRDAGEGIYDTWKISFAKLAKELNKEGVRVFNCTPNSALRSFPTFSFDNASTLPA